MRKMEVSGAFITPAITPAMPTSVNETSETCQSKSRLQSSASSAPVKAPTKSDGAKVPPTPPAALVEAMAMTLKNIVAATKSSTTQSMSRKR